MANQGTKIEVCNCKNSYQDIRYGRGKRLHNMCNHPISKAPMRGARCTVCGTVKPVS